jgi:hypothetical protein
MRPDYWLDPVRDKVGGVVDVPEVFAGGQLVAHVLLPVAHLGEQRDRAAHHKEVLYFELELHVFFFVPDGIIAHAVLLLGPLQDQQVVHNHGAETVAHDRHPPPKPGTVSAGLSV